MAEIIISVASKVAEYLVAPLGRQLGYLFNYQCNLDELKKQVEELDIAIGSRQRDVDGANRQGEEIEPAVQKWLTDTAATMETAKKFIEDEEAEKKSCFNVKSRYQRSRAAKKQASDIVEEIQKNNKFDRVSYCLPPQRTWSICLRGIETFESRESTLNQIMEALKSDDINLIGVWGMGGVGKTTLANRVMKLAEEDQLFDKVVMASNISQIPNVSKIQGDIAGMLGLEFKENESELVRADRLRKSLKNHKKLLVILDDLWKELSMEKIGIPYGREGCKVLLTSRNLHLLSNRMGTQKSFQVKQLSAEEAWSLFKTNAGDAVENQELRPTAFQVAKKCGGLPVAIITIAKALKGESVAVWKNALDELERYAPMNIEGVTDDVYSCLELSYNYLKSDEMKCLFLLCAMLGSGDILMGRLLQYAMGLNLFQQNLSLDLATNKLVTLVKKLKDSSLLLDDEDRYSHLSEGQFFFEPDESKLIRMHDVVRDVARSIASKDPHQFVLKEAGGFEEWQRRGDESLTCTHISLSDSNIKGLPERLVCPKLQFFFLRDYNYPRCLKIPSTFFEEMKKLKVLHLIHMDLPVLPSSFNALINLQTLCLNRCALGDVAMIGALKKLRVLSFEGSNIKQLPTEMMQLTDLRVLDLSASSGLRVIPRNLISSLSRLEYLRVGKSFSEWGAKQFDNDGETNACLSELMNLSNLSSLVINAGNLNLLPKDMVFEKLIRYQISSSSYRDQLYDSRYSKVLKLGGIKSLHLVNSFSELLKTTQFLGLEGLDDGKQSLCEFVRKGLLELKHLHVMKSGGLQYVFNSMEWVPSHCAFPILESLALWSLENLDAVWYGPIPKGSFGHLRELRLTDCRKLKYVMLLSATQEREFVFPNMKDIRLESVPELINFCSVETSTKDSSTSDAQSQFFDQQIAFPSLESLKMLKLNEVGTVWQDHLHAGSFQKLKSLEIRNCSSLRNVYLLHNLEILKIAYCDSLDEIFDIELKEEIQDIVAAQLRELSLENLPLLKSIGSKVSSCTNYGQIPFFNQQVALPNLESLKMLRLNNVGTVWQDELHARSFWKLKSLEIRNCSSLRNFYLLRSIETLKIAYCDSLDEIFDIESEEEIQNTAKAALRELSLEDLPCLKSIGSKDSSPTNDAQTPFFEQQVSFPSLESLKMLRLTKVGTVWQDQLHARSFRKLKRLEIRNCNSLRNVYLLRSLETLKIASCDSIDEIFDIESKEGIQDIATAALRELYLEDLPHLKSVGSKDSSPTNDAQAPFFDQQVALPSLESLKMLRLNMVGTVWQDQLHAASFQKLKNLEIRNCSSLRNVYLLRNLETLKIAYCDSLGEIFDIESKEEIHDIAEAALRELSLEDLPHLKSIGSRDSSLTNDAQTPFFDQQVSLPSLESLKMLRLNKVGTIWLNQLHAGLFRKLKDLEIRNCNSLRNVYLLRSLEILKIAYCDSLDEIFDLESKEEIQDIAVAALRELSLEDLPHLKSIGSKDSSPTNDAQTPFFDLQVALPSLESLKMIGLGKVGTVWQDQLHARSFRKLKSLEIRNCSSLRNVYLLRNLETLKIACCDSLGEIFDIESKEEIHDIAVAALRELSLENLPHLKSIWSKDPQEWAAFQNLQALMVWDCSLVSHLFRGAVAKGLENLETLHVGVCELLEEIVADENGDIATPLLFPKLTSLKLNRLGNLKCIYRGTTSHVLQWPLLKDLEVRHCSKMEILFQGLGSKAQAEADINGVSAQPPLFFVQKDTFPNLEKLTLTGTTKIWEGQFSNESFGKLQHLEVTECNDISAVISSTIIPILHNVKHLKLTKCGSVKEVFQVDEQPWFSHLSGSAWIPENLSSLEVSDCENLIYLLAPSMAKTTVQLEELTTENCSKGKDIVSTELNVAMDDSLVFTKLERVLLCNLPNLKSFGSTRYPLKFPSLKVMTVKNCGVMESFCGTFSESTQLLISGLPQLTQLCMQIAGLYQNLQNIQTLMVWNCENLLYLVTPSMARSLLQLKWLSIKQCDMMTEVVGHEGDGTTSEIVFPRLQRLSFYDLPKLKSFCSSSCYTFNFPSLKILTVKSCYEMEFFCEGVLNTPRQVKVNNSNLEGNLNTTIKKIALEKDSK